MLVKSCGWCRHETGFGPLVETGRITLYFPQSEEEIKEDLWHRQFQVQKYYLVITYLSGWSQREVGIYYDLPPYHLSNSTESPNFRRVENAVIRGLIQKIVNCGIPADEESVYYSAESDISRDDIDWEVRPATEAEVAQLKESEAKARGN